MKKRKVLFVGGFKNQTKDGGLGGQIFACNSLINSDLKNIFEFTLLDTTAVSIPAPPVYKRIIPVIKRFFIFLKHLFFSKIETVLIFSSSGFSFYEKGMMAIVAKLFGKNIVFAPRSGLLYNEYHNSRVTRFFMRLVIRNSNTWICQGESWKEFYSKVNPKQHVSKFITIYNWIDIIPYRNAQTKSTNQDNMLKIMYLGWLEEYKGTKDFFQAILKIKDIDVKCEIYGKGRLQKWSEDFINENNLSEKITLMGWADFQTKINAFHENDIFILPSHAEGFPNVVLEAMAAGICVISSDVSAVPELIKDGVNGMIFTVGNVNQLVDKILILNKNRDLLKTISKKGTERVLQKHTIESAVESFRTIL